MSLAVYKILHIFGIVMALTGLTAFVTHAATGKAKADNPLRAMAAGLHGAGVVIAFVAGFGALAKAGVDGFPGWFWAKVVLWLILAAGIAFPYRQRGLNRLFFLALPVIAGLGAWLALTKPF